MAPMADVLIRDVSEDTIHRLKARARLRGVSMQSLLKGMVESQANLSMAERLAILEKGRFRPAAPQVETTLDDIHAARALRP